MAPTLDDLPPEIVALIVVALVDDDGLSSPLSLAVSSSRYQDIVEDIIWRELFVRTGQHVRNIWVSLRSRPKRGLVVRKIDLRAQYRHEVGLQKLAKVLDLTPNLLEITIESPTCNYQRWRGDGNWPVISQKIESLLSHAARQTPTSFATKVPPLQMLKRLVLHSNGDNARYFDLRKPFADIFLHPCLEELTVSCATIADGTGENSPKFTTPLKHLTLIECNVTHGGLSEILAHPRALETFYLGENRHHHDQGHRNRCDLLRLHPAQTRAALEQQAHSLQSFTYRPQNPHADLLDASGDLFANFTQLRKLFLDARLSEGCQVERGALQAAPQLSQLAVIHMEDDERFLRSSGAPSSLGPRASANRSLIYSLAQQCLVSTTLEQLHVQVVSSRSMAYFRDEVNELAIDQTAKLLDTNNVRFKIFFQLIKGNLIPPFLYGEEDQQIHLLFDSAAGGWQPLPSDVLLEQSWGGLMDSETGDEEDEDEDDDDEADLLQAAAEFGYPDDMFDPDHAVLSWG